MVEIKSGIIKKQIFEVANVFYELKENQGTRIRLKRHKYYRNIVRPIVFQKVFRIY